MLNASYYVSELLIFQRLSKLFLVSIYINIDEYANEIILYRPKTSVKLSNGIIGEKFMCNDDSLGLNVVLSVFNEFCSF